MGINLIKLLEGILLGTTASIGAFIISIALSFVILAVILGSPQYFGKQLDRYFMWLGIGLGVLVAFNVGGGTAAIVQAALCLPIWHFMRRATKSLDSF